MIVSKLSSTFAEISPSPTPVLTDLIMNGNPNLVSISAGVRSGISLDDNWITISDGVPSATSINYNNDMVAKKYSITDENGNERCVFDYDPFSDLTEVIADIGTISEQLVIGDRHKVKYFLPILEVFGPATFDDIKSESGTFARELKIGVPHHTQLGAVPILEVYGTGKFTRINVDTDIDVLGTISGTYITAHTGLTVQTGLTAFGMSNICNLNITESISFDGINITESIRSLTHFQRSTNVVGDLIDRITTLEIMVNTLSISLQEIKNESEPNDITNTY